MNDKKIKYLYVMNSVKPSKSEFESTKDISLNSFQKQSIIVANDLGYDITLGINRKYPKKLNCLDVDLEFYNSNTFRNIFSLKDNYIAYKNLSKVIKTKKINIIHCNTPIGGVVGRLCGYRFGVDKVIYMVHGFHFYSGGNFLLNHIYKFIETYLAKLTDVIITINEEDYIAAKKMTLKENGKVYKVHGVGISLNSDSNISIDLVEEYRHKLGLKKSDFVCIGTGRLDSNKNFEMAINLISKVNNHSIKLIICGVGEREKKLKKMVSNLKLESQVLFLGFREDISNLLCMADCFISTSKREGLSRSVMEGMRAGLPCIVSNIRGNRDLIDNEKGGYLINDEYEGAKFLNQLYSNQELRKRMKIYNLNKIKQYSEEQVYKEFMQIYSSLDL